MTSSLIILMSDESESKATKLGYGQTGQDRSGRATHDRRERRKMQRCKFQSSQNQPRDSKEINDRDRARQRSFGQIIGLRPVPNDFSPCREGNTCKHRTKGEMSPTRGGSLTTRQGKRPRRRGHPSPNSRRARRDIRKQVQATRGQRGVDSKRPFLAIKPEVSAAIFAARPFEPSLPSQR